MPRGVSRKKHPEAYKDAPTTSGMKASGVPAGRRGRRTKTGGRIAKNVRSSWAGEKKVAGAGNFGQFGDLYNLSIIRQNLTSGHVNDVLLKDFDQLVIKDIEMLQQGFLGGTEQVMSSGAIIEKQNQPQTAFNPPPPSGQYQRGATS